MSFDPEKVNRFCITREGVMSFAPEMAVKATDYDRLLELYRKSLDENARHALDSIAINDE